MAKQAKPAASVTETHEWMRLNMRYPEGRYGFTGSYRGFRCSAPAGANPDLIRRGFNRFVAIMDRKAKPSWLRECPKYGDLMKALCEVANEATSFEAFVGLLMRD